MDELDRGNEARLRSRMRLALLALLWERLWPALWPPLGVAGLFLAVALLDVLPLLPPLLHASLLVLFAAAYAVAAWKGFTAFRLPAAPEAKRRLERDSGMAHRPLTVIDDRLAAGGDAVGRALWQAHRRRMLATIRDLRVGLPSPGLPAKDPRGLRAGVLLLLVIALSGTWHDIPGRLGRAVSPALAGPPPAPVALQVWITPPAYTGVAPLLLEQPAALAAAAPDTIPAGSKVMALLQGGRGMARLLVNDEQLDFAALDGGGSQRREAVLDRGRRIAVMQGPHLVAEWRIAVVLDSPPAIEFASPPEGDQRGRLKLDYEAGDDYGVVKGFATIRRVGRDGEEPVTVPLPLRTGAAGTLRQATWQDLSAHPWAGQPVTITPEAVDAAEQRGSGRPVDMILPERDFSHPVARAIIEQRRSLYTDAGRRKEVAQGLDRISVRPDLYGEDTVVFLALRVARARLLADATAAAVGEVGDILWNTALRLEEGNRAVAERVLSEAMEELERALREGAPQEEIERLMQQLAQAMQQFMQALAEQMQRQGLTEMPFDPNAEVLTSQDLAEMMRQMRDLARTGSRDAARQLLSDLQQMMQNLRGMPNQTDPATQQAGRALNELQQMLRQQRELLDQSFGQSQRGEADATQNRQAAGRQDELRRRLGEVMQRLGESLGDIPQGLGQAEQAMRDATGELRANQPGAASDDQQDAMQGLQQGLQAGMDQLAQRMQQQGQGMSAMPFPQGRRDPLGRRLRGPGMPDDRSVKIPDQADMHRAREILDELRRRLGEPGRSEPERDYLRRLLRQF